MSNSEIFKAAHRQAKHMEYLGCAAYNVRFSEALRMMYKHRNTKLGGYSASLCHTLTTDQRGF